MSLLLSAEEFEKCRLLSHEKETSSLAKRRQMEDDFARMTLRKLLRAEGASPDYQEKALHALNIKLLEAWK